MKVSYLTASLSRAGGGFFQSVRRLAVTMSRTDSVSVRVFGLEDGHFAEDRSEWLPLDPHVFPVSGPKSFGYAPALRVAAGKADPDLVHVHGLWMYPGLAGRRVAAKGRLPLVVSPRGMLDPWALGKSRWKKRLVGRLFEKKNLRSAACLHALCDSEAESIRAYGLSNPIAIIPNGVDPAAETELKGQAPWRRCWGDRGNVLLFLGRIHLKKGLAPLLDAWRLCKKRGGGVKDWRLAIVGWEQEEHGEELKRRIVKNQLANDVKLFGSAFGDTKAAALRSASAFILPSYSEGLPMSILEAWAHGLPVLMTPECNIPAGFQANAAVRISSDPERLADSLAGFFETSASERRAMGERGKHLAAAKFSWPKVVREMLGLYEWLLDKGSRPDCVRLK